MSWKEILKNDNELRNYLEYLIQEDWRDDMSLLAIVDGIISNDPASPNFSYDHKEAQDGIYALESYGGHETGDINVYLYRGGKQVYPTPISTLLKVVNVTEDEAKTMMSEDENYDPNWKW